MRKFIATVCLAALASVVSAETIRTTDGISYTKAADGKFYRTELITNGTVKAAPAQQGCVGGKCSPAPAISQPPFRFVVPQQGGCPNGRCVPKQ